MGTKKDELWNFLIKVTEAGEDYADEDGKQNCVGVLVTLAEYKDIVLDHGVRYVNGEINKDQLRAILVVHPEIRFIRFRKYLEKFKSAKARKVDGPESGPKSVYPAKQKTVYPAKQKTLYPAKQETKPNLQKMDVGKKETKQNALFQARFVPFVLIIPLAAIIKRYDQYTFYGFSVALVTYMCIFWKTYSFDNESSKPQAVRKTLKNEITVGKRMKPKRCGTINGNDRPKDSEGFEDAINKVNLSPTKKGSGIQFEHELAGSPILEEFNVKPLVDPSKAPLSWNEFQSASKGVFVKKKYGTSIAASDAKSKAYKYYQTIHNQTQEAYAKAEKACAKAEKACAKAGENEEEESSKQCKTISNDTVTAALEYHPKEQTCSDDPPVVKANPNLLSP